ncbi:hypothetical protein HOP50_03g26860 [Chloropicon primus]|uniref:Uncharacterized protein n=1 Tax=Chloropicon primus TaxID=1764295 RepID=A0A5B8MHQ9_9CHLO|nr:hypothetical protein A3770_03p26860 [Chloropicon primus]UPQ99379.1 hypothetical protein HOP50_03g26860 [Chloropicon primus]|eukprot:QDZ20168.1 hypothetical protein A3770_03p26860 [Chloropicon primus]
MRGSDANRQAPGFFASTADDSMAATPEKKRKRLATEPPNIKRAHRRWKAEHGHGRVSPSAGCPPRRKLSGPAVCRRLYSTVRGAKESGPFCEFFRDLVEGFGLRDGDGCGASEADSPTTAAGDNVDLAFHNTIQRRLDSMFENLPDRKREGEDGEDGGRHHHHP